MPRFIKKDSLNTALDLVMNGWLKVRDVNEILINGSDIYRIEGVIFDIKY
jgi:hypothetical protein